MRVDTSALSGPGLLVVLTLWGAPGCEDRSSLPRDPTPGTAAEPERGTTGTAHDAAEPESEAPRPEPPRPPAAPRPDAIEPQGPVRNVGDVVARCASESRAEAGAKVRIRHWHENGAVTKTKVVDDHGHPEFARCVASTLRALPKEKPARTRVTTDLLEAP